MDLESVHEYFQVAKLALGTKLSVVNLGGGSLSVIRSFCPEYIA